VNVRPLYSCKQYAHRPGRPSCSCTAPILFIRVDRRNYIMHAYTYTPSSTVFRNPAPTKSLMSLLRPLTEYRDASKIIRHLPRSSTYGSSCHPVQWPVYTVDLRCLKPLTCCCARKHFCHLIKSLLTDMFQGASSCLLRSCHVLTTHTCFVYTLGT
jgi:hypothetical protein